MKDKIIFLMKSEGLSTSRLAEILSIQPSAVSHLASGRNKPGYDLLQKILRRFPRINPDWLLLDEGEPYRADESSPTTELLDDEESSYESTLFSSLALNKVDAEPEKVKFSHTDSPSSGSKSPIFVVLFYDDGSCERFSMK